MKNFTRLMMFSTALAFAVPLPAQQSFAAVKATATQSTPEQAVEQAFQTWILAVGSGKSENITKLYTENAVLLPTFSPKVHNTPALRKGYFETIAALKKLVVTVQEQHLRIFGNIAINSGLYTFSHEKDGKTVATPARFTFVYEKTPQGWSIVEHHSSKVEI
jgi:uncharacterized protein (TIGR02246 family)